MPARDDGSMMTMRPPQHGHGCESADSHRHWRPLEGQLRTAAAEAVLAAREGE